MNDFPGNDYVAVAKFRLEGVHEQQGHEGMTDATMIAAALDAQAQATLALAFEQRTTNLIAVWQHLDTEPGMGDTRDHLWMDHITPRLGLGGDET